MWSLTTHWKAVSAYTGSPFRAVFVEIACFSDTGTLVPAGIMIVVFLDSTDTVAEDAAGSDGADVWAAMAPINRKTEIEVASIFIVRTTFIRRGYGMTRDVVI